MKNQPNNSNHPSGSNQSGKRQNPSNPSARSGQPRQSTGGQAGQAARGSSAPAARGASRSTAASSAGFAPAARTRIIALIAVVALLLVGGTAFALTRKPAATADSGAGTAAAAAGQTAQAGAAKTAAGLNASGDLVIPVSAISSKATFYPATVDGVKLEVLAVKAPDNSIRTAFNTCQVCYDSGRGYYKQEGDVLVCQNCGNRFKISQVEVSKGGCNPVPIFDKDVQMGQTEVTIPAAYLKQAKVIFENWKANA